MPARIPEIMELRPAPVPVYVVHSRKLEERRERLARDLRALGWSAEWIEDPDHVRLVDWIRRRIDPRLNLNEINVYLKHEEVLRRIAAGRQSALVFEDDPVFPEGFGELFGQYLAHVPADYDLVFFGASCGMEVDALAGNAFFGEAHRTRSMSALLITPGCAARLVEESNRTPIARPVDLATDEAIRRLRLRVYWSVPVLIQNGSEIGAFPRSIVDHPWRRHPAAGLLRAIASRLWKR